MAIVKVLSRHSPSYASLVKYILRYIVNEDKTDKAQIYTNNLRSNTVPGFVKEFIENEVFRKYSRSDQIHLFHEIVSFGADEKKEAITPAMVDDLAQEYMRLRGNTGVMLGAAHHDKAHIHLHFCVSALQYRTGMSFGLNKSQLQELKQSFQKYHKQHYPELTKSFPNHGSRTRYINHAQWHRQQREQIITTVQQCLAQATSQQHFLELLQNNELHHYERNGTPTGIEHDGLKFRFSRLLEEKQFESLPIDRNEEDTALGAIRAVRERQETRNERNRSIDNKAR
jgi:hypothetical protein